MKIEIWSDIACPFCYIGKRKLDEALANFPEKNTVDVIFRSYQLDPNAPLYTGQNYYDSLASKFGSIDQAKQMTNHVSEHAKQAGLEFNFDNMKATNTRSAHRLIHYANKHHKANEIVEKLFAAHFIDGEDIGNITFLTKLAGKSGLNENEVKTILEDKLAFDKDVQTDINEAAQFGITGVPYFIFNRKYAISGAQPKEAFSQAIEKVHQEEKVTPAFENITPNSGTNTICDDDSCAVPDNKEK